MREGGLNGLPFRSEASSSETTNFNNFLSLSEKESVVLNPVITVLNLRKN